MTTPMIPPRLARQFNADEGNCFLWGCAALVLVAILGTILAGLTFWFMVRQLREKYTETEPVELPVVEIAEEDLEALIQRVDDFAEGLREAGPMDPLTLTQDELNALIQYHPDLDDFAGRVYFTLEDEAVTGQVSVSLDVIPGFGGRYFNGSATFDVALENGRFTVFVNAATFKGEPVPEELMEGIRGENLAGNMNEDDEARELIDKINTLAIENGAVTITPVNILQEPTAEAATPSAWGGEQKGDSPVFARTSLRLGLLLPGLKSPAFAKTAAAPRRGPTRHAFGVGSPPRSPPAAPRVGVAPPSRG